MSKRSLQELCQDILEAGRRILDYTEGISYETFQDNTQIHDAVVRNLEVLGEAARRVPENDRARFPKIPWREMAGTRDRLIHDYFGVNLDIVWEIIQKDLTPLLDEINKILR